MCLSLRMYHAGAARCGTCLIVPVPGAQSPPQHSAPPAFLDRLPFIRFRDWCFSRSIDVRNVVRYYCRFFPAIVVATTLSAPGAPNGVLAQTPALSYPASDSAADIDKALSAAARDGKHVLLDFGADWCPDCRVLGALFEDPVVAPFATENFHIVRIDVGRRDKNADLIAKYQ